MFFNEISSDTIQLGTTQLECPVCGSEYVHFTEPKYHEEDDYTSPTGHRGPWVEIGFWSELCNHTWKVVTAFHKGESFIRVMRGSDTGDPEELGV